MLPLLADDMLLLALGQVSPAVAIMLEMFVHAGAEEGFPPFGALARSAIMVIVVVMVLLVLAPLDRSDARLGSRSGAGVAANGTGGGRRMRRFGPD